jgi:hypothetical protein
MHPHSCGHIFPGSAKFFGDLTVVSSPLRRFTSALAFLGAAAACCALSVGCSSGKGDVRGTVTFKGAPLKGGIVTFVSEGGGPNILASIHEDGTYTASNVASGRYKVCVDTESLKPSSGASTTKGGLKGSGGFIKEPPGSTGDLAKAVETGKIKTGPPASEKNTPGAENYQDPFARMKENAAKYVAIPLKYAKPETTDLTIEVSGGTTYNIELKP